MSLLLSLKRIKGVTLLGLLIVICAGMIFGYGTGINGNVTTNLWNKEKRKDPKFEIGAPEVLISSSIVFGAFLGSPVAGFMADKFGRKIALLIGTVLSLVGNTVCMFGNKKLYWVIVAGRFVFGVALGFISSVAPLYMAETSPDDLRGFLGVFFQFSITFTIFLATFPAFFVNVESSWRIMLGILYIPIGLLGAVLLMAPESPRFLVGKKDEKARELFTQIFTTDADVDQEIVKINEKNKETTSWGDLFAKENSRSIMIGVVLAFAQQFTGINAIIYYYFTFADKWFAKDQVNLKAVTFAGLMGWNCLTSMCSIPLTKSYGRRTLLLIGQAIMFASLLLSFGSFLFPASVQSLFTIAGIAMFILGFEISVGPLFFVVINEIFPEALRGRIGSIMTGLQWLCNTLLTVGFKYLEDAINPNKNNGYVFLVFALVGILTFSYQLFFLPETRNLSFKEIQDIFQRGGTYFGKGKEAAKV